MEFTFQLTAVTFGIMNLLQEMKIIFIQQRLKQLQHISLIFYLVYEFSRAVSLSLFFLVKSLDYLLLS